MPAVITFAFDPLVYIGDVSVRVQTIAIALIVLAALLLLARIGQTTPTASPYVPPPTLRPSALPFLVLGVIPGAVIGGRLDYVLVHLDYYIANPGSILDPAQGALGLGLAVPGAVLGAFVISRFLDEPFDRWMHAAALPTLFALGAGKISSVLAAEGQGRPADVPWATAYLGDGPWSSLAAYLPSHPAQIYEAGLTIAVLLLMGLALAAGAFARRDGSSLLVAIALWAMGRALAATTWRDAAIVGPFGAEQLILAIVVVACFATVIRLRAR
ncbi:MAG: prolipoprotein diacylglyceryl transferase family protein [Chloroflexota bacterium]